MKITRLDLIDGFIAVVDDRGVELGLVKWIDLETNTYSRVLYDHAHCSVVSWDDRGTFSNAYLVTGGPSNVLAAMSRGYPRVTHMTLEEWKEWSRDEGRKERIRETQGK